MTSRVLPLIPAYNEAARSGGIVIKTRGHANDTVVIDDGSTDDTAGVAERAGAKVLRREQNCGKGSTIVTGLDYFGRADEEFAILLDADGQHDPEEIPKFIEAARAMNADVVVGTRMTETRDMPLVRKLTNQFTAWLDKQTRTADDSR